MCSSLDTEIYNLIHTTFVEDFVNLPYMTTNRLFPFIFSILLISVMCCKKNNTSNPIPETNVDVYIYTSNPSFLSLTAVGGWAYVNGGVRGLLVYRKSNTEFMAYDRNCTYNPSDVCSTVIVKDDIYAIDTCCHSEFLLPDGSVLKAPASLPLKAYRNTFDGNVLHIYN